MDICLIRHGDYITEGISEDALYPLSEKGKQSIESLCKKLEEKKLFPNRIYSSPLLRATESSQIISRIFSLPFEKKEALIEFDSSSLLTLIQESKGKTIFFVGHAPFLIEFAALLASNKVDIHKLEKATAIHLQFEDEVEFQLANYLGVIS
jgi:phosphohistidine phosphatase